MAVLAVSQKAETHSGSEGLRTIVGPFGLNDHHNTSIQLAKHDIYLYPSGPLLHHVISTLPQVSVQSTFLCNTYIAQSDIQARVIASFRDHWYWVTLDWSLGTM